MTAQDGAVYSAGIISCWVVAYFIRVIILIVRGSTNE